MLGGNMPENPSAKIQKQLDAMTRAEGLLRQIQQLSSEIEIRVAKIDQLKIQLKQVQDQMKG